MFSFLTQHRSIRRYKDKPVEKTLLEEILKAGFRASSSGNMQTASVVATHSPERKKKLYNALRKEDKVLQAPYYITFCADLRRIRRWLVHSRAPLNFDNPISFMIGTLDSLLVAQNVALAAEAAGLGICYIGATLACCQDVIKALELPRFVMPVAGFCLGWPDENPALRDRLPLEAMVHWDHYTDLTDEDLLAAYKDKEEKGWERYMQDPELARKVKERGLENLAQIYTAAKYTLHSHRLYSQNFLQALQQQGFWEGLKDPVPEGWVPTDHDSADKKA